MTGNLLLLWLAAIPLMGSPGPATISLAAVGATYGMKPALLYLCGIVAGTAGVLLMISAGLTGLVLAQPQLAKIISAVAALYILFLAYRISIAPVGRYNSDRTAPTMAGGFVLAIFNPKAYAAIGAVFSSIEVVAGNPTADALVKLAALLPVIVTVNAAWLWVGSVLAEFLQNQRYGRAINLSFALLLVIAMVGALI